MKLRTQGAAAMIVATAALGMTASQASAAPVTISTDAGTTCTLNADANVGRGLVVKPVNFAGEVSCSLADPANPAIVSANLILRNSGLPLGIGEKAGTPDSSDTNRVPVFDGFAHTCELSPGADCSHSGNQPLGVPGQTYTALFGAGFTPPEGESWVSAPAGCTLDSGPAAEGGIACASQKAVTVR